MAILTIARLTLREASRRRLLLAIAVLTLVVAILSAWAFHRLLQFPCGSDINLKVCSAANLKLIAATLLILLMFMFSFVLALGAAFLGAPSIATDLESGIVLAMLPRPIRRSDVVIGKWLGLSTLITLYATISCGLEFVILKVAVGYVPPHPILAIAFLVAEAVALLTLTLLGSTRLPAMTCGIIVLVLFGMTWMGGVAGAVGAAFNSRAVQNVGTVSSLILPTDGLWRAAVYDLQPAAIKVVEAAAGRESSGNPFFVNSAPPTAYLIWAFCWIATLLALATWSFKRREL